MGHALAQKKDRLERLNRLQESLSHKAVLARGFALVRDESGALLRSVSQAPPGAALEIEVTDGRIAARAGMSEIAGDAAPAKRKSRKAARDDQGSLF